MDTDTRFGLNALDKTWEIIVYILFPWNVEHSTLSFTFKAVNNLAKLKSRQERGTIQGSGDNR